MGYAGSIELLLCDEAGCSFIATRGNFCIQHAHVCESCRRFFGAHEMRDGACYECRRAECEDDLETYVSARCVCGGHR